MSKRIISVVLVALIALATGCKVAKDPVAVAKEPAVKTETAETAETVKPVDNSEAKKALARAAAAEEATRAALLAKTKAEEQAKAALAQKVKAEKDAAEAIGLVEDATKQMAETTSSLKMAAEHAAKMASSLKRTRMYLVLLVASIVGWFVVPGWVRQRCRQQLNALYVLLQQGRAFLAVKLQPKTVVTTVHVTTDDGTRTTAAEVFDAAVVDDDQVADATAADEFADVSAPQRTFKGMTGAEAAARCAERANPKRRRGDTRPMPAAIGLGDLTAVGDA